VLRKKSPGNSTQIMALCERGRGPLSPPGESSIPRSRSAGLFAYYVKSFTSWNPLLALVYAQFSSAVSLRGLEAGWNANRQHHYHLGSGPLVRSTLADASKRRPVAVFAETFSLLASQLDQLHHGGAVASRLPIVTAEWSALEWRLCDLFGVLLGTDRGRAEAVFFTVRSNRSRCEAVESLATLLLPEGSELRHRIDRILRRIGKAASRSLWRIRFGTLERRKDPEVPLASSVIVER
jgi:Domain of unknown function (DUF4372)